jgi:benzoate membrane transport protein
MSAPAAPSAGPRRADLSAQAVATGVTAALLGYASSIAVVVAGLVAVGATRDQVASALLALGVVMAVASTALSLTTRIPVSVVWSTPGLALLAGVGPVDGGWPAVLGAFCLTGALIVLTGLFGPLTRLLQRLPPPLTSAVLAGVLLPFCLAPAAALAPLPLQAGAICLAWLLALRLAPSYAAPVALGALLVVVLLAGERLPAGSDGLPRLGLDVPVLTVEAVTAVALPLYLVTMGAQNLVGLAVLRANGYAIPVRRLLVGTGLATVAGAPFGSPPVNLAAITGALTAGPSAHPDPARRWVTGVSSGLTYLALGALSPVAAAVIAGTDPRLVATAAGLGLFGAFTASAAAALREDEHRAPAAVTLLVTASGVTLAGLGSAPLGLAAGLLVLAVLRRT